MVNDRYLVEALSPQQWRVWALLRDGEPHSIDVLFRQALPLAREPTKRRKQQKLGAIISRINAVLATENPALYVAPGEPRSSYQLFRSV